MHQLVDIFGQGKNLTLTVKRAAAILLVMPKFVCQAHADYNVSAAIRARSD